MLKYSRKHFTMYICGAVVFFVAVAAVSVRIPGISDHLAACILIVGFALLLVWCVFCNKRAVADYTRMVRVLDEQCDPEEFVKAQRGIYSKARGVKSIRSAADVNAVVVRMNQAVALSFGGQHREAMNEAHSILDMPMKKNRDYCHALSHINLSVFHSRRNEDGDIAAAREHIRKAGEHIKAIGQSSSALSGELVRAEYIADAMEGKNLEAARDYFSKNAENAPVARAEAVNRFQLALIFRELGDTENERAQLEFVVQTAPKAHIGKQAAARLAEFSAR